MKKKRVRRGLEKERKKESKTESVKRRCDGFVSVEAELRWSFLEETYWRSTRTCLIVVLVVTDVPISPSSVVTEFCEVFSLLHWLGILWNRSPFLSPESVHIVVQVRKKR